MRRSKPTTPGPWAPGPSPAWSLSTTCPAGTSGRARSCASSPTTATPPSAPTSTPATAPAARTTPPPRRAPPAARATRRVWGTSPAPSASSPAAPPPSLAACRREGVDAAVDCWGGGVIVDDPSQLNEFRPVAPIDLTERMTAPLLGLFGNDDRAPTPEQVDRTEEVLKRLGKTYEFHRYDGAGHAFFCWDRAAAYRAEQAVDGWNKVFAFYEKYLKAPVAAAAR